MWIRTTAGMEASCFHLRDTAPPHLYQSAGDSECLWHVWGRGGGGRILAGRAAKSQVTRGWAARIEGIERALPLGALKSLGLSNDHYQYLATVVDRVIHAAARVNLVFPCAMP